MNEDKIVDMLLNHEERLVRIEENMVTQDDHREVMSTLDKMMGMMTKRDQETTMITHAGKRREDRIEVLETDMAKVKPMVGLS